MNVMGCRVTLTVMGCLDLNKTLAVTMTCVLGRMGRSGGVMALTIVVIVVGIFRLTDIMTCVLGRMGRSGNVMTSTIIIVITGIIRLTHFMTMIKL